MVEGVLQPTKEGSPQGGPLTPPTKVQNFLFACVASFLRKKGKVDSVDDSDLLFLDHNSVDQGTQNLATHRPVCRL